MVRFINLFLMAYPFNFSVRVIYCPRAICWVVFSFPLICITAFEAALNWKTFVFSFYKNMPTLSPKLNYIPDMLMHHSEFFWWSFIGAVIMFPVASAVSSMAPDTVQFSRTVVSDSLHPHGMQQARLPWLSPTPGAYSNSPPPNQWCHPTISSSVVPFSSRLQSFPASGSFQMSQFFTSGGRNIGVSASTSVLPMNIQNWFPLGWTGWVSLQSKGLSKFFSNTTVQKHQFFGTQLSL